jgi:tetratricopeptide (TPR) repeat protein
MPPKAGAPLQNELNCEISKRMRLLAPILLLIITILSYLPAFQNGFVYDDHYQIEKNPYIRDFSHLKILLTKEVWYFSPATKSNNYRPVSMLAYLLIHQLFGFNPIAYHSANLLFYLATVLVVWRIFFHYVSALSAFLGGLLFAVHPAHVECVAWIGGSHDILCGLFLFTSLLLYLQKKNILSLVSFAFALFSKETALAFPLIVAADYFLFRKQEKRNADETSAVHNDKRNALNWCAGAAVLIALYSVIRIYALGSFLRLNESSGDPVSILHAGLAFCGLYLSRMLLPIHLNAFYDFSMPIPFSVSWPGLAVLLCALILVFAFRSNKTFLFGSVWFTALLLPALFSKGVSPALFAERYLYLPSAGFFLALISFPLTGYIPHAMVAIALLFGGMTYERSKVWHDDLTLWKDTVEKSPLSSTANYNLGTAYARQKNYEQAALYYHQAIISNPSHSDPYYDLAVCQHLLGRDDQAVKSLQLFLKYSSSNDPRRKDAEEKLLQLSAMKPLDK